MQRSIERILTTHTGSLPRPEHLVRLLLARETGESVDPAAVADATRSAVLEVVQRQVASGVDVVNDGEQGKPGYSTYVKERLTGFSGTEQMSTRILPRDVLDFQALAQRFTDERRSSPIRTPTCTGPIAVADHQAVRHDIDNLRAAVAEATPTDVFMTAASPGVIALFLGNTHYPSREAYLAAIAEAMREEYAAIVGAGYVLQVDCPDLAMGRHIQFGDASLDEFRRQAALNVEALNHALGDLPPEQLRMHLCWGNYEGPHHRDVPLRDVLDIVLRARPSAISLEASNPRHAHEWQVFEEVKLPEGKVLIPGVVDSTSNFIEHPELIAQRIVRYARLVGRENVLAGTDCGFGTFAGRSRVDPDIVWAKFRAMADGAQLASRHLWARAAMGA
jgi:5-methyltetrahydropteroyltriglutamate--homocysteine methyltransferase